MAPSRKRGANKGAASAAARRKWKVGDLVLAKVKGFPAWPATVSEPQKWGYPADLKKVVVYFFGTQQIAFCNPTEIEEFTEEKKVSLLGKRHGKGADFVRAVKEISECFDKLKKQEQVSSANGTEETNITNEYNSEESMTKCVKNEPPVLDPLSVEAADNLKSLTEAAVAAAAEDALHDKEMHKEIPSNCSTGSKRDIAQSRTSGSKGSRSDQRLKRLRIDTSRGQNIIPLVSNIKSSRQSGTRVLREKSLRRSRRFIKSSDGFGGQGTGSLASVSNDSTEESDSETMSVDSDTLSVNDGSTIVLGSKPAELGLSSENNMLETTVSGNMNFETKNIIKKSGVTNPKGDNDDAMDVSNIEAIASDAELQKYECFSPSSGEKSAQRNAKDESDEHLPFAKRARVRLGRALPEVTKEFSLDHKEVNILEVPENPSVLSSEPLSCKLDLPSDQECSVKENLVNSSCASPARNLQFPEAKKNFVDGEAALPPSKRLHRALEAMSANAVDDFQGASNSKSAVEVESNDCCPFLVSSELPVGTKAVKESRPGGLEDLSNGGSPSTVSELCIMSNMASLESNEKNDAGISECGNNDCMDSTTATELFKNFEHAEKHNDSKNSECTKMAPSVAVPSKASPENHVKPAPLNICEQLNHLACDAPDSTLQLTDGCKIECTELNGALKVSEISSEKHSDNVIAKEVCSPDVGKGNQIDSTNDAIGEAHKMSHLSEAEKNPNDKMCDLVEEIKSASLGQNTVLASSPAKALGSSHDRCIVHPNSVSRDQMDDRTVSVTLSSSSLTDGPGSVARASPPSSSVCNIPASDNINNTCENNGSCSPDVHLHLEKAKLAVKSSSKWESLSSFEAIIKSLTRTKESIGRATRIAINCAKFGLATKVVEMLVHSLEGESSLRKKVDLFFLVDSITQCSRGMKGDAGIYPSAIQALLPRLLLAAAPPGSSSYENHRQCLKVLRVWQERRILPEPIIRHHIQQLDALCGSYPSVSSRRPLRNERAFDDPIRQMEGMLVDEYGSNSSIQLAGFCMPPMLSGNNGGSESDGESFEAVTPEHNTIENCDGERTLTQPVQKRSHILEDVDGELEMEDVAPSSEVEGSDIIGTDHHMQTPHHQFDNQYRAQYPTQPPNDVPLTSAPLSGSLPPPLLPPHQTQPVFPPTVLSASNGHDSKSYSSSQNLNSNLKESVTNQPVLPSVEPTSVDAGHHQGHDNYFGPQLPRQMMDSNNGCTFSDQPNSVLHSQASNGMQPTDAFSKGFHLRPPLPSPTNQFSYVQEPRIQPWGDAPPPPHPNRFRTCNAENGNFYRDHDRNNFIPCDNIGDCWRPPFPAISGPGPCYNDGPRMVHPPMYNGPPRDPAFPNNRWNFPPPPMNNGHYNPYGPTPDGPIPVANRGPNFWRPR